MIADMATEVEAARALGDRAAWLQFTAYKVVMVATFMLDD